VKAIIFVPPVIVVPATSNVIDELAAVRVAPPDPPVTVPSTAAYDGVPPRVTPSFK